MYLFADGGSESVLWVRPWMAHVPSEAGLCGPLEVRVPGREASLGSVCFCRQRWLRSGLSAGHLSGAGISGAQGQEAEQGHLWQVGAVDPGPCC